ncbi:S-layer homology domain-containing protein [Alkalicoccus chagannorensis]|uniref:S-layer homology domain-containing protein n=1 Tax=Alkalicoccus chagannorensis TaxID=427072 RepID=UPI00042994B0|nr:S-layer homology domain-containing protein [Alkalicoccus chagannorensis]
MLKRTMMAVLVMILSFGLTQPASASSFSDVEGHSLEKEMNKAVERDILAGFPDGTARPDEAVTRAQFATFFARALDLPYQPDEGRFNDVDSSHTFAEGIFRASSAGLIQGYPDGGFAPDQEITREEMATLIYRAMTNVLDMPSQQLEESVFIDEADIHSSHRSAVEANYFYGVITGHPADEEGTSFRFAPKDSATRAQAAAFITRMQDAAADFREEVDPPEEEDEPESELPDVDDGTYRTASIDSDGSITVQGSSYDTYEEAEAAMNNSRTLLLSDDRIVKMEDGLVLPKQVSNGTVNVYTARNLVTSKTYASGNRAFGSEFNYQGAGPGYVEVSYAGASGYMDMDDVELIPTERVEGRNHYEVSGGTLYHRLYNPIADSYTSYSFGPAPSFLSEGTEYLSEDGSSFYTTDGSFEGEQPQYFNKLSVHSSTNYSAEDLDRFLEEAAPSGASPLAGEGDSFKEAEEEYGINALYLMAKAIHESSWGRSEIAQDKNNLFGLNATDEDPYGNADEFHSFEDSILFAGMHMKETYGNVENWRFSGSVKGHKALGFNIRYASDMFWGQKIAGHMYRADRFLGEEDYASYDLGVTNTSGLNVRPEAGTSRDALYRYSDAGMPVIIHDELRNGNALWYEVQGDKPDADRGFIHGAYIDRMDFPSFR